MLGKVRAKRRIKALKSGSSGATSAPPPPPTQSSQPAAGGAQPAPSTEVHAERRDRPFTVPAWIALGTGVVAAAIGTTFVLLGDGNHKTVSR